MTCPGQDDFIVFVEFNIWASLSCAAALLATPMMDSSMYLFVSKVACYGHSKTTKKTPKQTKPREIWKGKSGEGGRPFGSTGCPQEQGVCVLGGIGKPAHRLPASPHSPGQLCPHRLLLLVPPHGPDLSRMGRKLRQAPGCGAAPSSPLGATGPLEVRAGSEALCWIRGLGGWLMSVRHSCILQSILCHFRFINSLL